jgi:DNA polymerase III epsilon subunit-like protein
MNDQAALLDRARTELEATDQPLDLPVLARAVYRTSSPIPNRLCARLAAAIDSDRRFHRSLGMVSLAAWEMRDVGLQNAEFVAIDVESNGGASGRHRIVELGAVRFGLDGVRGRFETLVACPEPIARAVTRITGIRTAMLAGAPGPAEALEALSEFCLGAVLVAHNLPSDLGFLNLEARWAGLPAFSGDGLDTMAVATWQFADDGPFGLARTLELYGLPPHDGHRAGADAEAVRKVFLRQAARALDGDIGTIGQLRAASRPTTSPAGVRGRLLEEIATELPALPGVYRLLDAAGSVIYVGMARSLQRRVRSHLANSNRHVRRREAFVERIDKIEFDLAGSELEALVLEQEQIARLRPEFNRQVRSHSGPHYVAMRGDAGQGQLIACRQPPTGAIACAGPFRTAANARRLAKQLRSALGVAARWGGERGPSDLAIGAGRAFLGGGISRARRYLDEVGSPEAKRILRRLNAREPWPRPLPGGESGGRVLVVAHDSDPAMVALWLIEGGSVVRRGSARADDAECVARSVEALLAAGSGPLESGGADVSNRIDRWLIANADDPNVIWIDSRPEKIQSRVRRALRRLGLGAARR